MIEVVEPDEVLVVLVEELHAKAVSDGELELARDLGAILAHLLVPPRPVPDIGESPWSEVP